MASSIWPGTAAATAASGSPSSAQAQQAAGLRDEGALSDISADGCCITTNTLFVNVGMRVLVKPKGMEGLTGIVRWIDGNRAGVQFDLPLYGPVVEHLTSLHGAGQPLVVTSA